MPVVRMMCMKENKLHNGDCLYHIANWFSINNNETWNAWKGKRINELMEWILFLFNFIFGFARRRQAVEMKSIHTVDLGLVSVAMVRDECTQCLREYLFLFRISLNWKFRFFSNNKRLTGKLAVDSFCCRRCCLQLDRELIGTFGTLFIIEKIK